MIRQLSVAHGVPIRRDEKLRKALLVACPYCLVPKGEWCRASKRGKWSKSRTAIHDRRIAAGQKVMKPVQGDLFCDQFIRTSGDVVCEYCARSYREHPMDEYVLSGIDNKPFFHVRCDGMRLKL